MILAAILAGMLTMLGACSGDDDAAPAATSTTGRAATTTTERATTTSTTTTTLAPTTTTPPPPTTPAVTSPPPTAPVAPTAPEATASVPDAAQLGPSWHEGCPVPPDQLRVLTIPYIGFDGGEHTGTLIVHADAAIELLAVFRTLYDARYPIERMVPVSEYGANDDASTKANNTSAFNCRQVTGGGNWSQHSYGRAIDINPVQNPYVYANGTVLDPAAEPFIDRSRTDPGTIHAGDVVVQSFAAIGWGWGGNFRTTKDYQHFSATGG